MIPGTFDVTDYEVSRFIATGIVKPYSEHGNHAWNLALSEAISTLPKDKVPANMIVFDRESNRARIYNNKNYVKMANDRKHEQQMKVKTESYIKLKEQNNLC